jgi:hypothetical protein
MSESYGFLYKQKNGNSEWEGEKEELTGSSNTNTFSERNF